MLEALELQVTRGGAAVLHGVTAAVRPGQVLALCGPNGAGKSTLLAALAGELAASGGRVLLDGQPLTRLGPAALARRRAVLEQTPTVSAPFSVLQLVLLGAGRNASAGAARSAALQAIDEMGLTPRLHHDVLQLSGGQRHRAHLARTLVQLDTADRQAAPYLLLDEPTASLDIARQIDVMRVLRRRARAGTGIAVVLHDLNLAAACADSILLLHHGQAVAEGPPATALTADRLSTLYETTVDVEQGPGRGLRITPRLEI